ncbi:MAG: pyridoxal phosphate-dependent aminotransferase [Acidobacteria bacterium]|nr:pyridoxal phosphate-dependent aminotransferase [Acidobacteriota bacterium]
MGEPTWPTLHPELGFQAAIQASPCSYGPNSGLVQLRESLAEFYALDIEQVRVTHGAQAALCALLQAYVAPGDSFLMPNPGFPGYHQIARLMGARAIGYPLAQDPFHALSVEAVVEAMDLNPDAKVLLLNHPSNPTGGVADEASLLAVLEAATARGVLVLCDEVYRPLSDNPLGFNSLPSMNLVRIGSLSKAWAAAGLRIGWMLGDPEVLAPAVIVHSTMVTAASNNNQQVARWLIRHSDRVIDNSRRELARRWSALSEACATHWGWVPNQPPAGFYLWLALPENVRCGSLEFCLQQRDTVGVVLVPGSAFGSEGEGFVRLSFAAEPDLIREGIRRLAPIWGRI